MGWIDDLLNRVSEKLDAFGLGKDEYVNVIERDGVEYTEVMRLDLDGNTYLYFSDLDHPENFFINKLEIEDGVEYCNGLDSDEEFDNALNHFTKFFLENNKG